MEIESIKALKKLCIYNDIINDYLLSKSTVGWFN